MIRFIKLLSIIILDMGKVVLTADRTLMTEYNGLSPLGHFACLPDRMVPGFINRLLFPRLRDGLATYAIRRMESSLLDNGFDVSVLCPQNVNKIKRIKPDVVGISTVDPLTTKPHPWTLNNILGGGKAVTEQEFYNLLCKVNKIKEKQDFKIIIGGPGASEFDRINKYHNLIDTYVMGHGEGAISLFQKACDGEAIPKKYVSDVTNMEKLSIIKGAARFGHVQITQGCPRGCQFCAPTMLKWMSFPKERILEEIKINLNAGIKQISFISEDVLLYGSKDVEVNHKKLIDLMTDISNLKEDYEVRRINFSNVSIASVIKGKKSLEEMKDLMGFSKECPVDTVLGLETGSEKLIKTHMIGKVKPYNPDNWTELVKEGINILNDNFWYPICNMIAGLPGETEEDVIKTLNLVDDLKGNKLSYYIFYFVPMGQLENQDFFTIDELTMRRWELFYICWMETINFFRNYIDILEDKILKMIAHRIMKEIERDLNKYKKEPSGLKNAYNSVNLKGYHLFTFLARRYLN